MIDCSRTSLCPYLTTNHQLTYLMLTFKIDANSSKDFRNQPKVLASICSQLESGDTTVTGVMVESNLVEGKQDVPPEGPQCLKWGVSITDGCVSWETTIDLLRELNKVRTVAK